MKKILTLNIAFLFVALFTYAQQTDEDVDVKDPKAKAILDQLSAKSKSYSSVVAAFSYNLKNSSAGIDETQKGKLMLKGQKYNLKIAGQEIISDGKKVYTYIPDVNEVQVNWVENDEEESMFNPATLFTLYEKGFKYKHTGKSTKNGASVDVIKLYPENANDKPYHTVILYINTAKMQFEAIEIKGKDGNTYTYSIDSFKTNETLSDSNFTFDVSKADDVIDFTE
tara:strand:+ start:15232 stop:15906 length:675 start_codon:yes stop_codon:yes gene_type:complete